MQKVVESADAPFQPPQSDVDLVEERKGPPKRRNVVRAFDRQRAAVRIELSRIYAGIQRPPVKIDPALQSPKTLDDRHAAARSRGVAATGLLSKRGETGARLRK